MPLRRVAGADDGALVLVDATSGAGGLPVDVRETDVYYFAPQKSFASDGGLWLALMSPAAIARVAEVPATGRWIPAFSDLQIAIDNSRLDQTYNTPALATLFLLADQVDWLNGHGGLDVGHRPHRRLVAAGSTPGPRSRDVRDAVRRRPRPTLRGRRHHRLRRRSRRCARSRRCCGPTGSSTPSPTASSGRNQLRIAMFPAVEPADVEALTACIDHVVAALARST